MADEFKVFTNINSTVVDPKNFDSRSFVDLKTEICIIPPNSFALAKTVEYFRIPRDVLTICVGKSTYARCGLIVADATGKSPAEGLAMAMRFLRAAARRRSAAIGAAQARQEALALASLRAELGALADEPGAGGSSGASGDGA